MIELKSDACTGCNTCVKACPHGVLELHGKKAMLVAEDRCIECGACQLNCHDNAIVVTKGTGCLLMIIKEDVLRIGVPKDKTAAATA